MSCWWWQNISSKCAIKGNNISVSFLDRYCFWDFYHASFTFSHRPIQLFVAIHQSSCSRSEDPVSLVSSYTKMNNIGISVYDIHIWVCSFFFFLLLTLQIPLGIIRKCHSKRYQFDPRCNKKKIKWVNNIHIHWHPPPDDFHIFC